MIACVSPGFSSANHTINTLRYSDRLKEKKRPQPLLKEIKENNYFKNNFNIETEDAEDQLQKLSIDPLPQKEKIKFKFEKKKQEPEDWEYLKKSCEEIDREPSHCDIDDFISDEFIHYADPTEKNPAGTDFTELNPLYILEQEIVNSHMQIIKDDAKLLTEEGDLISNIKGVGEEVQFEMEDYTKSLENIIDQKLLIYSELKKKLQNYNEKLNERKLKNFGKEN